MTKQTNAGILTSLVMIVGLFFLACGEKKSEWEKTKESHTTESYEAFVRNNPDSEHLQKAYTALETIFFQKHQFGVTPISYSLKDQLSNVFLRGKPEVKAIRVKYPEKYRYLILNLLFSFEPDKSITDKKNIAYGARQIIANHFSLRFPQAGDKNEPGKPYPAIGYRFGFIKGKNRWQLFDGKMIWNLLLTPDKQGQKFRNESLLFKIPSGIDRFSIYFKDECIKGDVLLQIKGKKLPSGPVPSPIPEHIAIEPLKNVNFPKPPKSSGAGKKPAKIKKKAPPVSGIGLKVQKELPPIRLPQGKMPVIIKRVPPVYPEIAKKNRIRGIVILNLTVNTRGKVININVLKGHPQLNQAAVEAVRQWQLEMVNRNTHPMVNRNAQVVVNRNTP